MHCGLRTNRRSSHAPRAEICHSGARGGLALRKGESMAGFRTHVGTSSALGCGYAGVLNTMYGVPMPTATVAGALCGLAGMLPDLDSDYGVPLREAMSFAAATIPVFLVNRFESLQLSRDTMVIIAIGLYLFVRFGVGSMIRKFTV